MDPLLLAAADFAAKKHATQRRKDVAKTPYINHPIAVANYLAQAGVRDVDTLICALLHDVVEDTDATLEEVERLFGKRVRDLVADVTDDRALPREQRKRAQVEHVAHALPGARLVKMADKLHNLSTLLVEYPASWTPQRVQGYFVWGRAVVAGCRGLNAKLEAQLDDLFENATFKGADGKVYRAIPEGADDAFLEEYYLSMR